jgi:hypothetical protein
MNKEKFNNIIKIYLDNLNTNNLELETRFGTIKQGKKISRLDHDNVIQKLVSNSFTISEPNYYLRINSNFVDPKTGVNKISNIRSEITGLNNISKYCKTNSILSNDVVISDFVRKSYFRINNDTIYPVNFDDFNFRLSLNSENKLSINNPIVKNIINNWSDNTKIFRYIKRHTLKHPDFPFNIDVSIVKESTKKGNKLVPKYTIQDSDVFNSIEKYEIEIEVDNRKVGLGTNYSTVELLGNSFRKMVRLILSGLQETNYPISYTKQNQILNEYMFLLWGDKYNPNTRIKPKNFVGPSSFTLQVNNITNINTNTNIPNIRNNYTVTDKADGLRKLLYISKDGSLYLIDTNMNVQYTGCSSTNKNLFNTLLDGEHILHDKNKKFINLYASFDVYYVKGQDVRMFGFVPDNNDNPNQFRLPILVNIVNNLNLIGVNKNNPSIRIEHKNFYSYSETSDIFSSCKNILTKEADDLFEYNTDGLIFTPAKMGVGSDRIGTTTKPLKKTWEHSFKWKPPEFNTIDFLISTRKNQDNTEFIGNIFNNGIDMSSDNQIKQYKTLILRVGFNERFHGYINPCKNIIDDDIPEYRDIDNTQEYKPLQFFPTNPSDNDAGICNVMLTNLNNGKSVMMTEEGEIIDDNTIVEFKYDLTKENLWRWVPLRVRYDKTADFRSGGNNFGNAYHVANSNWHSIHNPITVDMITTGLNIPDELGDDDVYYNRVSNTTNTRALRDFHNLFVKKKLITNVSRKNNTLIDYAVGKGGDLPKWIDSKLKFIFGIDISKDNIENRLDGACARYLNYRKKFKEVPDAIFINGNSGLNIRNTDAIYTSKSKEITNAIFGKGAKDINVLGKGIYKSYGIGENGFNISSIQFAIHYMFENNITLNNFIRNVSENTIVGGHFIGTSYDGKLLFNKLKNKKQNESLMIQENGNLLWKVTKKYDQNTFNNNRSSVGYAIDVYQESINKTIREYLVNYSYLTRIMEDYGFVKLTHSEALKMGFKSSSGNFRDLFNNMIHKINKEPELKNNYGEAMNMNNYEKQISFLNRYFIYKKVRNVDTMVVYQNLTGNSNDIDVIERDESINTQNLVKITIKKHKIKKLKKRIILK